MLEVINGFLLIYFLILCTFSALIPNIVKPVSIIFTCTVILNLFELLEITCG